MPGFNGTGPAGMGPMTGKGRGYCLSYVDQGTYPGPWFGRGGGRGRRYATGKPRWARRASGAFNTGSMHIPPPGEQQELNFLRDQVSHLENALEQAKKRIGELENKE